MVDASHTPDKAGDKLRLQEQIAGDPISIVWGEQTVTGIIGNFIREKDVVKAGMEEVYEFSVMTVRDEWTPNKPVKDEVYVVDGERKRLLKTGNDALRVGLRLDFGDEFATYNPGEVLN